MKKNSVMPVRIAADEAAPGAVVAFASSPDGKLGRSRISEAPPGEM
jgi:hypothetical protein